MNQSTRTKRPKSPPKRTTPATRCSTPIDSAPEPFDLRSLVRDVFDNSTLADPGLIAEEVYKRIGPDEVYAALQASLRLFVRQVISERRMHTQMATPTNPDGVSWKVGAIREHWRRSLQDSVHVGGSEWKRLGQCTYEDLKVAAAERREQASRNRAKAQQYEALANLVSDHGAATVAELPVDVLSAALGAAA